MKGDLNDSGAGFGADVATHVSVDVIAEVNGDVTADDGAEVDTDVGADIEDGGDTVGLTDVAFVVFVAGNRVVIGTCRVVAGIVVEEIATTVAADCTVADDLCWTVIPAVACLDVTCFWAGAAGGGPDASRVGAADAVPISIGACDCDSVSVITGV